MAEPGELRVADADRQATVERLQVAAVEGRLDLDEYDRRVRSAYAAVRYADLAGLTADLPPAGVTSGRFVPSPQAPPPFPRAAGPPPESLATRRQPRSSRGVGPPLAARTPRPAAAVAACLACPPAGCLLLLALLVATILASG